jgi:hypothetical protein
MSLSGKNRRAVVVFFLLAMTFCNGLLPLRILPKLRNGYQDFTIFYTGARLLRSGEASHLYNLGAQYRLQQTFTKVPIRLGPLPFNHPPFEALLFIPFTFLAYWPAYLLWTGLNLVMLAAIVILLRMNFSEFATMSPVALGLGTTAFFPLVVGVMQGQDIILLLLFFVLAVVCLERGKDAAAGAILAMGLFRPHIVVALIVLLAVRRWRVLLGFAPVALILAALSVALTGWHGPVDYVRFVLHVESSHMFGPQAAPNLRGLISDFPGVTLSGPVTGILIFAASMLVFVRAALRIKNGRDSVIFLSSLAAVTTVLIGFHAFVYDLCLIFPAALLLLSRTLAVDGAKDEAKVDAATLLLVLLLFLTPIYLFLLLSVNSFFWFSLVVLGLYCRMVVARGPEGRSSTAASIGV